MSESDRDSGWDDWVDDMDSEVTCLFCSVSRDGFAAICEHMRDQHDFNLVAFRKQHDLDFYQTIRCINYIRKMVEQSWSIADILSNIPDVKNDDTFLVSQVEDDPMLYMFDNEDECLEASIESIELEDTEENYQEKYVSLMREFQSYKDQVAETFRVQHGLSKSDLNQGVPNGKKEKLDYYFGSYSCMEIHEDMLKDRIRTEAYRDFIYDNKTQFRDKVVLDVGCGTGILSMFAAKAGARKVYAVDNSHMIEKAREIVELNGFSGIIECIRGRVEEIQLPEKVDIIVSEWMGYFLLFEAMLDSVLVARDRFLKPDGIMAPSQANMYLAAVQDDEWMNDKHAFWQNVYGFNMVPMRSFLRSAVIVDTPSYESVVSNVERIAQFQCQSVQVSELDFLAPFRLELRKDTTVHALCGWFDTVFDGPTEKFQRVVLDTSPLKPQTHWRQVLLLLEDGPIEVSLENTVLRGTIEVKKNKENYRALDIVLELEVVVLDSNGNEETQRTGRYSYTLE